MILFWLHHWYNNRDDKNQKFYLLDNNVILLRGDDWCSTGEFLPRLPLFLLFWFMTHWLLLVLLMFIRRVLPASRAIRMSSSSVKARINSRSHYLLTHSLFTHSLMQVTSYNVLSSSLCEPSYYPWCSVSNLDQSNRLEKVKNKLNKEIQSRAIICLQVTH